MSLGVPRTVVRRGAAAVLVAGCAGGLLVGVSAVQKAMADSTTVNLGAATPYAVLASGTVKGSGTSKVTGDVGGSTVSGLSGQVTGAIRTGNDIAQALTDLDEA